MPKLRILSADDVCRILQTHGFVRLRQAGSHIVMRRQTSERAHGDCASHSEISRGTLKSIIEQSGLSRELFMT